MLLDRWQSLKSQHSKQTGADLSQIRTSVNNTKSTVNTLERFLHPCGGSGWHRAVYRDFRDITTDCPMEWDTQTDNPEKPYTCGRKTMSGGTCDATSFPVDVEYSKVCGHIKAYQVGPSVAFFSETEVNINERYLDGISLTHGGIVGNAEGDATHIWSFSAGSQILILVIHPMIVPVITILVLPLHHLWVRTTSVRVHMKEVIQEVLLSSFSAMTRFGMAKGV